MITQNMDGWLNPEAVKLVGKRIAELESQKKVLLASMEKLITTGEQGFSDILSLGHILNTTGREYRKAKQNARDAIFKAKGAL